MEVSSCEYAAFFNQGYCISIHYNLLKVNEKGL